MSRLGGSNPLPSASQDVISSSYFSVQERESGSNPDLSANVEGSLFGKARKLWMMPILLTAFWKVCEW